MFCYRSTRLRSAKNARTLLARGAKKASGPSLLQNLKNKFVNPKDLNKRPSALEIASKDLPPNTPTLGQRIRRDRYAVFHEYDRKSGYYDGPTGTFRDFIGDPSARETVVKGFAVLKGEIKKWKEEALVRETDEWPRDGERKTLYDSANLDQSYELVTVADSMWGEGYSNCDISVNSDTGKTLFSGELSTRIPRDGRIAHAGYTNFSTKKRHYSFFRVKPLGLHLYTHLVLRIRGDGRVYMVNFHTWEEFDFAWQDLYTYPLYTRGGPYWQEVKIPFSKFILTNRQSIMDQQIPLIRSIEKVYKLGVTLKDQTDGPFSLEIDYIGVELDKEKGQEECAYESYRLLTRNYTY